MRQPDKDFVRDLIDRYARAKQGRSNWETQFEDINKYVRPTSRDFHGGHVTGRRNTAQIYDGTAMWASTQLASGLKSFLTPDSDLWVSIGVRGTPNHKLDRAGRVWVDETNEIMHYYLSRMESNFSGASHETFLDLVSYGTAAPYTYWHEEHDGPAYKVFPLSMVYLEQNNHDDVDVVFRDFEWTIRQIKQEFGVDQLNERMLKMKDNETVVVTHATFPNTDAEPVRKKNLRKKYHSIYFSENHRWVFKMGGNDLLPYHVSRWSKISGDTYGISPGLIALPDILALQTMQKELLIGAQLSNRPPTVFDDDSFMLPIAYKPGAMIFRTPGTADPKQLTGGNDFNITLEMLQQKQEKIAKDFFIDWLLRPKKKERQSVFEVQDDREEMFRQMGAILGRIERELLGPQVRYTYKLLEEHDKLPVPPASISGKGLTIEYVSPAASAQMGTKGNLMLRFVQDITPLIQIDPSIGQGMKWQEMVQKLAAYRGVPPEFMLSPEEMQGMKEQQAQQAQVEQQAQMGAAMQPAASAMKDIAAAKASGLNVLQ